MISHCGLNLHFSDDSKYLFVCLLATLMSSLEKCIFRSFAHFLMGCLVFSVFCFVSSLYIFDINYYQMYWQIYFPVLRVVFLFCWWFPLLHENFLVWYSLICLFFLLFPLLGELYPIKYCCVWPFVVPYRNCVESIDCFGWHAHFNDVNSSYPWTWYVLPLICIFFNFFLQCLIIFWVQIFYILG